MTRSKRMHAGFLALFWVVPILASGQEPFDDPKAQRGKRIFDGICSVCHGLDGEGQGELGFKLTSREVAAWSDEELRRKIAYGNLTIGMPRFGREFLDEGRMTDFGSFDEPIDIDAIVAYLRVMQRHAREGQTGGGDARAPSLSASADAGRGLALFNGKARCADCHRAGDEGGIVGPDLSHVAARLDRDAIYDAIARPSRVVLEGYRSKELSLGRGKTVRGIYRNETSTSIEIFDPERRAWTVYDKSTVRMYRPLKTSAMPDGLLGGLDDGEIADLLAYLAALK